MLQGWGAFQTPKFLVISSCSIEERSEALLVALRLLSGACSLWPSSSPLGPSSSWLRIAWALDLHVLLSPLHISPNSYPSYACHRPTPNTLFCSCPHGEAFAWNLKARLSRLFEITLHVQHTAGVHSHTRGHTLIMHTHRCHFVNNALLPSLFSTLSMLVISGGKTCPITHKMIVTNAVGTDR